MQNQDAITQHNNNVLANSGSMPQSNGLIQFGYADITDTGCSRKVNEDTVFCSDNLWMVADGIGGHASGEVASELAVTTIVVEFTRNRSLVAAIKAAHAKVLEAGRKSATHYGMGTTVVAMSSFDDTFEIAWMGDSRAYLWQADGASLSPLTSDHTLTEGLIKSGIISAEQAKAHPQRHMLTRCVGANMGQDTKAEIRRGQWQPGQQILLCSDGLTNEISEAQIAAYLRQNCSNEDKLKKMVNAAKAAGGKDNISAILVDSPAVQKSPLWQKISALFL